MQKLNLHQFVNDMLVAFVVLNIFASITLFAGANLGASRDNLLPNASFEQGSKYKADGWSVTSWGTNIVTSTIRDGVAQDGNRSSYLKVSSYQRGDARWESQAVSAKGGETYRFKDLYRSNVATEVNAAVEMKDGSMQYLWLTSLQPSKNWSPVEADITLPQNAVNVSVYHLIDSNGWLETDAHSFFALNSNPNPVDPVDPNNLISNNGFEQTNNDQFPGWIAGVWGVNNASFGVVRNNCAEGNICGRVNVSNYQNGDAKWVFEPVNVNAAKSYTFKLSYRSNTTTHLNAAVTMSNGSTQYYWLADVPASTSWKSTQINYTPPTDAAKVTIFQIVASNGWLETDDYSLREITTDPIPNGGFDRPVVSIEFDDGWGSAYRYGLPLVESFGWRPTQYIISETAQFNQNYATGTYMTPAQVVDWNRRADVGSHSINHAHIPALPTNQIRAQLRDSQAYLEGILGENVNLYASPYCETSTEVITIAQQYYGSIRNCGQEMNTASNFDRWNIRSFIVLNTTTDQEIVNAINEAKAQNGWLVLVWHEVAGDQKSPWSVSQSTLRRQLQVIKNSGIAVEATARVLAEITQ